MGPSLPTSEVASAAELEHYAVERRRDRGLLGRRRGLVAFLAVIVLLTIATALLDRGDVLLGLGLGAAVLLAEVAFALVHHTRPERTPIVDTIEGLVEVEEESEVPHGRWFVGPQRVHVPPHWTSAFPGGAHVRVRVARPPGESLAFALAIEGRFSADFERARGLPPAPDEQPLLSLLLATAAVIAVPGLLIGAVQFGLGEAGVDAGVGALASMAAEPREGTVVDIERDGVPSEGRVVITDATVLPRTWLTEAPEDAGWAVLTEAGRTRLTAELETRVGRRVGGIPRPDETTTPVTLGAEDVLLWRQADLGEGDGPTGRPGNQVMVWLARRKRVEAVQTNAAILRGPEDAQNLAFAAAAMLLGLLAMPVLLWTGIALARNRARRVGFEARVSRAYAR